MSRVCQVTGKRPVSGNTVSHANNRKRRRFLPNLHTQRFWLEGEKRWISLRLSTNALRTVEKNGIDAVIAKLRARGEDSRAAPTLESSPDPGGPPAGYCPSND